MQIRVGLENGFEGRSLAWVLDHPGCFAVGQDAAEALLSVPRAVLAYADWVAKAEVLHRDLMKEAGFLAKP